MEMPRIARPIALTDARVEATIDTFMAAVVSIRNRESPDHGVDLAHLDPLVTERWALDSVATEAALAWMLNTHVGGLLVADFAARAYRAKSGRAAPVLAYGPIDGNDPDVGWRLGAIKQLELPEERIRVKRYACDALMALQVVGQSPEYRSALRRDMGDIYWPRLRFLVIESAGRLLNPEWKAWLLARQLEASNWLRVNPGR